MIGFAVGLILLAVVLAIVIGLGVQDEGAEAGSALDERKTSTSRGRFGRAVAKVGEWLPPTIP